MSLRRRGNIAWRGNRTLGLAGTVPTLPAREDIFGFANKSWSE